MAASQGLAAVRRALGVQSIRLDLDAAMMKAQAAGMRLDGAWAAHYRRDAHDLLDSLMDAQLAAVLTLAQE